MSGLEIFLGILFGLIVNEACELSPWAARKLVQWSACVRYTDPERAKTRAAELVSLIEERPGKLFKLATSFGFLITSLIFAAHRRIGLFFLEKINQFYLNRTKKKTRATLIKMKERGTSKADIRKIKTMHSEGKILYFKTGYRIATVRTLDGETFKLSSIYLRQKVRQKDTAPER